MIMALRNVVSVAENLLNRSKWPLNLHFDISKNCAVFCSTKADDTPLPPKRPPTAYMIFCKEKRYELMKVNPGLKGSELIKVLGETWTNLEPASKKPYEETARESTIVYGKLHKEFYESLTEEERCAMQKSKVEKRESKRVLKLKKALKESGVPHQPKNAYSLFVQAKAKEIGEIKSAPNFIRQVAEKWQATPEEEKMVYHEKAKEEKQMFENEIIKWKERMVEEGQTDLVKFYEEGKYRYKRKLSASDVSIRGVEKKEISAKNVVSPKKMAEPKN